jgi:hypothetical protein
MNIEPTTSEDRKISTNSSSMDPFLTDESELLKLGKSRKAIFKTKRGYINHDVSKKEELISVIKEEGITIKEASVKLNINYSTAKHIMKLFKKTGQVQS